MKLKTKIAVVLCAMGLAACTTPPDQILTVHNKCLETSGVDPETGEQVSYDVSAVAFVSDKISAPTQSLVWATVANGPNCDETPTDEKGKPIYMTGNVAADTNVRKDALVAFAQVPTAAANGLGSALVNDGNACKGPQCGLQIIAASSSQSGAAVDVDVRSSVRPPCGDDCSIPD